MAESFPYLAERIREALATGAASQLGVVVDGDDHHLVLRGPVDSEHARALALDTATALAAGRRVIDELEITPHEAGVRPPEQL